MDFKKVLDQTVREIKREINIKVLKVPEIEQKVMDATCNEPWGPHGSAMADIAQATRNYYDCQMVMGALWKRLSDTGANWRHVYKALTLLEYLIAHGSERVIDEIVERAYQISSLADFQYVEPNGKDQGINVRRKSQTLMALVNDKEKIQEARQKALDNRDKYGGISSTGAMSKLSSYYSTGGGYDSERSGQDSYSRDTSRDDEGYGRHSYKQDDRAHSGRDGDKDRSVGGRDGDEVEDERLSKGRPDSVNTVRKPAAANSAPDDFDDFNPRASSSAQHVAATVQFEDLLSEPIGSVRGSPPLPGLPDATASFSVGSTPSQLDSEDFGAFSSAMAVSDVKGARGHSVVTGSSVAEATGFSSSTATSVVIKPPPSYIPPTHKAYSAALDGAIPAPATVNGTSFNTLSAAAPSSSSHSHSLAFGGDDLFGLDSFGVSGVSSSAAPQKALQMSVSASPQEVVAGCNQANWPLPASVSNHNNSMSASASQTPSLSSHANTNSQHQKKFEMKSAVWADSISKGLIDLNITAPKSNSLADIGVNFDLLRTSGEKEEKAMSRTTTGTGKAMGSGSGLGLAGASAIGRPATPGMMKATGMAMGGTMPPMMQMSMNSTMAMRPGRGVGLTSAGMGMDMGTGFSNQQHQWDGSN